jgi:hypothetical protein
LRPVAFQIRDKNVTGLIVQDLEMAVLLDQSDLCDVVLCHCNINLEVNTPANPPSIAPDEYTNLSRLLPNATRFTLDVQNQLIPNPATAMPG